MTKLLISVRSAPEAEIACRAGADLIDIKEPARGSLGAADPATVAQIVEQIAGRRPLSVALGEIAEARTLDQEIAAGVQYAKFGLAGCGALADGLDRWQHAVERLPVSVTPVAVAYADWQAARAPDPRTVLAHAARLQCGAVLLDTFSKSGGPLFEQFTWNELRGYIAEVHCHGMLSVVAGGLRVEDVAAVAALAPDYIAVRGAVCRGDRTGVLDAALTHRLVAAVHDVNRSTTTTRIAEPKREQPLAPMADPLSD